MFAFNQCFAKADISGDVCFLFRKLYQVSVNAKVGAVRSESKTVLVDANAREKLLCGNDCKCGTESTARLVKRSAVLKKKETVVQYQKLQK